jgi:hypothetical protein
MQAILVMFFWNWYNSSLQSVMVEFLCNLTDMQALDFIRLIKGLLSDRYIIVILIKEFFGLLYL